MPANRHVADIQRAHEPPRTTAVRPQGPPAVSPATHGTPVGEYAHDVAVEPALHDPVHLDPGSHLLPQVRHAELARSARLRGEHAVFNRQHRRVGHVPGIDPLGVDRHNGSAGVGEDRRQRMGLADPHLPLRRFQGDHEGRLQDVVPCVFAQVVEGRGVPGAHRNAPAAHRAPGDAQPGGGAVGREHQRVDGQDLRVERLAKDVVEVRQAHGVAAGITPGQLEASRLARHEPVGAAPRSVHPLPICYRSVSGVAAGAGENRVAARASRLHLRSGGQAVA